jgi:hypothetical protein
VVQISTKFIADLKKLADLPKKMKEYDELLKGNDWRLGNKSLGS